MGSTIKTITAVSGLVGAVCLLWITPLWLLIPVAAVGAAAMAGVTVAEWTDSE